MKVSRLIELLQKCDPDSYAEIINEHGETEQVVSCAQVGEAVVIGHRILNDGEE